MSKHRANRAESIGIRAEGMERLTIVFHTETPQLNRRKKAFNGAGRDRREKILLAF